VENPEKQKNWKRWANIGGLKWIFNKHDLGPSPGFVCFRTEKKEGAFCKR
jgi:hypothetical protein